MVLWIILLSVLVCVERAPASPSKLFSVQLATFKRISQAERFVNSLPASIREKAFIYITDRGFVTVRIGAGNSPRDMEPLLRRVVDLIGNGVIVPTDPEKLRHKEINTERKPRRKEHSPQESSYFLREFESLVEELKRLVEHVFSGTNLISDLLEVHSEKDKEAHRLSFLKKTESFFKRRIPLYITGELRLRSRLFYEEENPQSRGFAYIGLRFSLFEEGIGEYKYKLRRAKLKLYAYNRLFFSERVYEFLLRRQMYLLREHFNNEVAVVSESKIKLLTKLEELLNGLGKLDAHFYFLKRKYLDTEFENTYRKHKALHLPIVDVDIDKLTMLVSLQEENLRRELELLSQKHKSKLEPYRDYRLDLYARYYVVDSGPLSSYIALGAKVEIPLPIDSKLRRELNELEFMSIRDEVLQKSFQNHSNVLDYAFRLKHNVGRIRFHLSQIKRNLMDIERELFFWKHGIQEVNYELIMRDILDIYDRLYQVVDYKFLNLQYAQRIILLLNLKDKSRVREVFYGGI